MAQLKRLGLLPWYSGPFVFADSRSDATTSVPGADDLKRNAEKLMGAVDALESEIGEDECTADIRLSLSEIVEAATNLTANEEGGGGDILMLHRLYWKLDTLRRNLFELQFPGETPPWSEEDRSSSKPRFTSLQAANRALERGNERLRRAFAEVKRLELELKEDRATSRVERLEWKVERAKVIYVALEDETRLLDEEVQQLVAQFRFCVRVRELDSRARQTFEAITEQRPRSVRGKSGDAE